MFVARNNFPRVKVARNTKRVGQACLTGYLRFRLKQDWIWIIIFEENWIRVRLFVWFL